MAGIDFMCFPVSKRTQNKGCCDAYGGASCGSTRAQVPANPAPITPSPAPDDNANLVFTQSAYGGVIPIVFGSDLISGNVIWASPFVKKTYTDAVKNTQKYYYSVSLAIALCEGEIDHVLRIYVGDKLVLDNTTETNPDGSPVRDVNGAVSSLSADLTTPDSPLATIAPDQRKTRITIYSGSNNQTPPPVMIDQEGYENTPAYRGTAFLLIENWLVTDSVPSLSVEVSANTSSLYPRLTADQTPGADEGLFAALRHTLLYLPGYNVYLSGANEASGAGNTAFAVWDGNTLEFEKASILDPAEFTLSTHRVYDYAHMLTSGNILIVNSVAGTAPSFCVWSPFSDSMLDKSLSPGTNGTHRLGGPCGSYDDGVRIWRGIDTDGNPADIVFTTSFPLGANRGNIAILTISDAGKIQYPFFTNANDVATRGITSLWGGSITSGIAVIPSTLADKTPRFPDGAPTIGPHVFYFSNVVSRTNIADTNIYVDRLDFDSQSDGSVSLKAPRMVPHDIIPASDLFGTRVALKKTFFCKSDNTLIVCADVFGMDTHVGGTDQMTSVIFKYDYMNSRIVWKTPIASGFAGFGTTEISYPERGSNDDVSNDKWAWVDHLTGTTVWSVDFKTGVVKKEFNVADQGMTPAPTGNVMSSRYNGREDSILMWGPSVSAMLYKVFLSRANRAQVALSTIITKLLSRVDWREADISIKGFDTLAVDGYTISSEGYTLRQAFNELQQVFTFDIVESNGEIAYKQRGNIAVATVYETKLQASGDGGQPWLTETHEYDMAVTPKLAVTYRDVERDYKTNVQSVQLPKYDESIVDADAGISVQVPIVLKSDTARKLAEILLYAKITYQAGYTGALPASAMPYDPSDVVTFKFNPADNLDDVTIRLRQTSIGADHSYQFTGSREDPDIYVDQVNLFGTLGRYTPASLPEPPTRVDFTPLAFPFYSEAQAQALDAAPSSYPVYMTLTSLRKSATTIPRDDITITTDADTYDVPAIQNFPTWGVVIGTPLANNPECYTTGFNESFTVRMMSTQGATLGSCADYYDMLNNRTKCLAWVGNELIQFQTAVDNGDGTWTFSVIRHALFGTEDGATTHVKGEKFFLIGGADGLINTRSRSKTSVELGDGEFKRLSIAMPTSKNLEQPDVQALYDSKQFRPFRPSAGQINYSGTDAIVAWKRRSRYNGQWADDGSEAGLPAFTDASPVISVPTFDLYLTKTPATFNPADTATFMRKVEVSDALSFTYTDAMQTADGFNRATETLAAVVYQTVNVTGLDQSLGLMFSRGPLG